MTNITNEIRSFYQEVVTTQQIVGNLQTNESERTVLPLSRKEFIGGISVAFLFLVKEAVLSVFYLIANLFTLFRNQELSNLFTKKLEGIVVFTGAIPIGLIGLICPVAINEGFLHIPYYGLRLENW